MGYGFGPGGYGSAFLDRFRNQYHAGTAKKRGKTRDREPESFHMGAKQKTEGS